METYKLDFPKPEEGYLKSIINRKDSGCSVDMGSVVIRKGEILPFKDLEYDEISYLMEGKIEVTDGEGHVEIMEKGDLIYLSRIELRQTVVLEDSKIMYFLWKEQ